MASFLICFVACFLLSDPFGVESIQRAFENIMWRWGGGGWLVAWVFIGKIYAYLGRPHQFWLLRCMKVFNFLDGQDMGRNNSSSSSQFWKIDHRWRPYIHYCRHQWRLNVEVGSKKDVEYNQPHPNNGVSHFRTRAGRLISGAYTM